MHSATCSIWSHEMKLKVSGKTGAIHVAVKHGQKQWAIYDYETQQLHHTNHVESFWRHFKHSIRGTHVSISQKWMKRYLDEFT